MNGSMDPLSDLLGADEFDALLAREEMRRARTGESLAVAVLDLDGVRTANARHGAEAGTAMLRVCADTLYQTLRAVDEFARTGPDEFAVLLHATDADNAGTWAERFEGTLERSGREVAAGPITCAVGIADTSEAPTLMEVAVRARRRMEVIQTMRKLRRSRGQETG